MLFGRALTGIMSIDYDDGLETKPVRGRGKKRIGRVQGNYEAAGSISLEMSEIQAIRTALPKGKTIYDIKPFDITVCYENDEQLLVTHVLKQCTFTKQNAAGKSGDVKELESKLNLDIAEIDWAA
jgi:hypothetical protein